VAADRKRVCIGEAIGSEAGGARARRVVIAALRGCNRSGAGDFRHEHFGRRSDCRSDAGAGKIEQSAIRRQVEAVPKQLGFRHAHVEARMADRVPAHCEGISRRLPLMLGRFLGMHESPTATARQAMAGRRAWPRGRPRRGPAVAATTGSRAHRCPRARGSRQITPKARREHGPLRLRTPRATQRSVCPLFYDPILAAERGWRSNNPVLVPLQRVTCVGCVTILAAMPRRQSGSAAGSSTCMRALRSQWQGRRMIIALHQRSVMPRA
jgi:hypothetical protein